MKCRKGCGACCIAASISSEIPEFQASKDSGVKCLHLVEDYSCAIWESDLRPECCKNFKPDPSICGNSRDEAIKNILEMEAKTGF